MQREFKNLVMTKLRRIAHPSREAQCIARLLLMQVILVCVAHAAQRAWMKRRAAGGDPGVDVMQEGTPATEAGEIIAFEEDPADAPVIPLSTLWESFYRQCGEPVRLPRPVVLYRQIPARVTGPRADCRILTFG